MDLKRFIWGGGGFWGKRRSTLEKNDCKTKETSLNKRLLERQHLLHAKEEQPDKGFDGEGGGNRG